VTFFVAAIGVTFYKDDPEIKIQAQDAFNDDPDLSKTLKDTEVADMTLISNIHMNRCTLK